LLQIKELALFQEKNGNYVSILVEGWLGIVGAINGDGTTYIQALKDAGAFCTIIGRGIQSPTLPVLIVQTSFG
jgi:hypothetical protein